MTWPHDHCCSLNKLLNKTKAWISRSFPIDCVQGKETCCFVIWVNYSFKHGYWCEQACSRELGEIECLSQVVDMTISAVVNAKTHLWQHGGHEVQYRQYQAPGQQRQSLYSSLEGP